MASKDEKRTRAHTPEKTRLFAFRVDRVMLWAGSSWMASQALSDDDAVARQ